MLVSVLGSGMMSGVYGVGHWGMDWGDIFCPILSRILADWLTGIVTAKGLISKILKYQVVF